MLRVVATLVKKMRTAVVASIPDQTSDEAWFWAEVVATGYEGPQTVSFEATGDPGILWDPYGQVAVDIAIICTSPALISEAMSRPSVSLSAPDISEVDVMRPLTWSAAIAI